MDVEPVTFRYVFINTNYLFSQIKNVLKDTNYGKMSREDCAIALRALADKVESKEADNQLSFEEIQQHLVQHLSANRRIK